jgi:integrase
LRRNTKGGRVYWTHRATGKRLCFDPWTPEGALEVHNLNSEAEGRAPRGASLSDLIEAFQESPDFLALAPSTRAHYQLDFAWLGDQSATLAAAVTEQEARQSVAQCRDARGVRAAQLYRTHMARLYAWGRERGWSGGNPWQVVAPPKHAKGRAKTNRRLTIEEIRALLEDAAGAPGYAVLLNLCLFGSLRIGDAAAARWDCVRGGVLELQAQKNGEPVRIKIEGPLAAALRAAPRTAATIATSERGTPWTKPGYDHAFASRRARLEAAGLIRPGATWHGLRHSLATYAREITGASDAEVAALLADKSGSMAAIYTRDADAESLGMNLRADVAKRLSAMIFDGDFPRALSTNLSTSEKVAILPSRKSKRAKA